MIAMLNLIKSIPFYRQSIVLAVSGCLSLSLLFFRLWFSRSPSYIFLVWNLFLAVLPYLISLALYKLYFENAKKTVFFIFLFAWLLFFPNAPYIVTDLMHLRVRGNVPYWYDIFMLFSFAYNGMIIGLMSLRIIHLILDNNFNKFLNWSFLLVTFFLTGFAIYLGRFLRWNSWDIVKNPVALFSDIFVRFLNPLAHPGTFGITIIMFAILLFSYATIFLVAEMKK